MEDKRLKNRRIDQQDILPLAVKQRNIDGMIIFRGLDAGLPADGSTEVKAFFATDTGKLYIWDGVAWVSATLT